MPPVMKLTVRWEESKDEKQHTMLKVTIPRGWKEGPTLKLKNLFIETHNKKHPDALLKPEEVHLMNPQGHALADKDILVRVFNPGDTARVKPGPPPSLEQAEMVRKAKNGAATQAMSTVDRNIGGEDEGHVASAEALKRANESKFAFDYSKWDRLDLSDDDGEDCHPNIDLASWKRLKGRQRGERREKEDKKIGKYKEKIEKYTKKVESLKKKMKKEDGNLQLEIDLKDAEMSKKEYEYKLNHFLETRKMIADDVCEVKENKGLVAPSAEEKGVDGDTKVVYPVSKEKEYDSYDDFQKDNRQKLRRFAQITDDLESQEFLISNPALLSEHSEGFLLILTLDTCMKHQLSDGDPTIQKTEKQLKSERRKEYIVGKQHLTVHYICELARSMKRNPLEAVKPFFRKTGPRAEDRVDGFEDDLTKFLERIRKRATEKITKGELNPLVDPQSSLVETPEVLYEPAGVGPGGLDPNDVLQSLPETLQQAFIQQDMDKLRQAFEDLEPDEAELYLKQCIDSGLWVPAEGDEMDEEEDDDDIPEADELPEDHPQAGKAAEAAPAPVVGDVE